MLLSRVKPTIELNASTLSLRLRLLALPMAFSMMKEFRRSLERLKRAADASAALAGQMSELLKLRKAVQRAEEAAARKKRRRTARPGNLFVQARWQK